MKKVALPWFVWLVGKFQEVIHGIQLKRRSDLILYHKAGILWNIRNAKGYTPILHLLDTLATNANYTKQQFEENLKTLSYISSRRRKIRVGRRHDPSSRISVQGK